MAVIVPLSSQNNQQFVVPLPINGPTPNGPPPQVKLEAQVVPAHAGQIVQLSSVPNQFLFVALDINQPHNPS